MKKILAGLTFFTTIGIVAYWSLVFSGLSPVDELTPGYTNWFMSFSIPDMWIAVSSLLAGLLLLKNKEMAVPFGIASGSSLVFLGIHEFLYGINTGLLFTMSANEIMEIAIRLYFLSVGTLFMVCFWRLRNNLSQKQ